MTDITDSRYNIDVHVDTVYESEQSDPQKKRYVFSYSVKITNTGTLPARLISRHWIITDADEKVQEVYGEGVVGDQPLIQPGDTYSYSSGTIIGTQVGSMHGNYKMISNDGYEFEAMIPAFTLAQPNILH